MRAAVVAAMRAAMRAAVVAAMIVAGGGCAAAPEDQADPPADPTGAEELAEVAQAVVYGADHRRDVYAHADLSLRRLARQAAVALMTPSAIDASDPGAIAFVGPALGSSLNLCPGERFAADVRAAFCSGTLIDDDLVLTAGHCVDANTCATTRLVFRFLREAEDELAAVTADDVFGCAEVVVRKRELTGGRNLDYAIVRLDRPAAPRFTPAPVRQPRAPLAPGQRVGIIGAPSSIPLKLDSGGAVRDPRAATLDYFVATTDSFGGNSGSGVYELDEYRVAGILVRGEADYRSAGTCNVVNTCPESGCRGEDVTYVGPALDELCATAPASRLCAPRHAFAFAAAATDSATTATTRHLLALAPGQTLTAGTCGVPGGAGSGDTLLRLVDPSGAEVAVADDAGGACGSLSRLVYTAPPLLGGLHELRAGCYGDQACAGTVAYAVTGPRGGSYSYAAADTASATIKTADLEVELSAGQTLTASTCDADGGAGTGDTFLRVVDPAGAELAASDDACGARSRATIAAPAAGVYRIRAGCHGDQACAGTVAYARSSGGAMAYAASSTAHATKHTADFELALAAGQTLALGTCGVPGASGTGDTYLRLYDAASVQVAANDNGDAPDCAGARSYLRFTAPVAGRYQLRAGCFAATACAGELAYTLSRNDGRATFAFAAADTASATTNTLDQPFVLEAGQRLRLGTCGLPGSAGTGDTVLRLFDPTSTEVASSDDACGGALSHATFSVPADGAGTYTLRAGCSGASACSGTAALAAE